MRIDAIRWGAALGALSVAIGAFGAHAWKPMLITNGRLETFELAVRYQFYHVLALVAVGLLMKHNTSVKALHWSSLFFILGITFFSGSLYVLCFTGLGILGAITPIGGVCFILGWIFLLAGSRIKK